MAILKAESMSEQAIRDTLDREVTMLMSAEAFRAALIVTWSVAEAAMRRALGVTEALAEFRMTSSSLIKWSNQFGVIDDLTGAMLLEGLKQRNAVVHGFDQPVHASDVERLRDATRSVLEQHVSVIRRTLSGDEPYDYLALGDHVVQALGVCGGRPTFRGTRIEVAGTLNRLGAGESLDEIVRGYRGRVSREAIQEAIEMAARSLLDNVTEPDLAGIA
jgi:uncharacterized protein (DUF433 family)